MITCTFGCIGLIWSGRHACDQTCSILCTERYGIPVPIQHQPGNRLRQGVGRRLGVQPAQHNAARLSCQGFCGWAAGQIVLVHSVRQVSLQVAFEVAARLEVHQLQPQETSLSCMHILQAARMAAATVLHSACTR